MGKGKGGGKSRSVSSGKKIPVRTLLLSTLWGAVVLFTGVCLIMVLNMPPRKEQARQAATGRKAPDKFHSEKTVVPADPSSPLKTGGEGDREYEEELGGMMRAVEQIDLALVQSLSSCGVKADKLRHVAIDFRKEEDKKYHFQEIELRVDTEKGRQILQELEKLLASWLPEAELESVPGVRQSWRIRMREVVTHRIALNGVIGRVRPEPEENGLPAGGERWHHVGTAAGGPDAGGGAARAGGSNPRGGERTTTRRACGRDREAPGPAGVGRPHRRGDRP